MLPTPRSYVRADGAVAPDHWLDPSDVWEVKCADLSLSPIYPAARGLVSSWGTLRRPSERILAEWQESSGRGFWGPRLCFRGDASEDQSWRFIWVSDNEISLIKKKEKKNSPGAENNEIDFFDFQIFTFSVFNFMFLLEYS